MAVCMVIDGHTWSADSTSDADADIDADAEGQDEGVDVRAETDALEDAAADAAVVTAEVAVAAKDEADTMPAEISLERPGMTSLVVVPTAALGKLLPLWDDLVWHSTHVSSQFMRWWAWHSS